jgi:4-hydroxy-4-methyl-2-oxoglutarate aldolase
MRLAGPAYPIEGRPDPAPEYDTAIRKVPEMLGQVPPGHVAVYQTNDRSSAHLGELSVTSLKARACAGAVIDGGCRDVDLILREDYPVFTRYTTPQDCTYRWELVAHGDVTVTVGEVGVAPGDYVVADADGIVVVPRDVLLEVLEHVVSLLEPYPADLMVALPASTRVNGVRNDDSGLCYPTTLSPPSPSPTRSSSPPWA